MLSTSKDRKQESASCAPPGGMNFGAIARDFERKILRPRKIFENFGRKSAGNRTQSRAPQHADPRHSCWGPHQVAVQQRHGFWRGLAAIPNAKFCGRGKKFEIFGPKSARNHAQSHTAQHADARHNAQGPLQVLGKLRITWRHAFRSDRTRFRTQNFAATKISVRNPLRAAPNLTRHSMLTLATDVGDL